MKTVIEKFKNKIACVECAGTGARSTPDDYGPCPACDGNGYEIISLEELVENLKLAFQEA